MMLVKLLIAIAICLNLPAIAFAHSGGTDFSGGHTDHDTGDYHYHHGYPAHDHYDMDGDGVLDCPYMFDDKTGSPGNEKESPSDKPNSSSITPTKPSTDTPTAKKSNTFGDKIWDILVACAMAYLALMCLLVVCELIGRRFKRKK